MRDPEPLEEVGPVPFAGEAHVRGDGEVREQAIVLGEIPDSTPLRAEVDVSGGVEPDVVAERDPPGSGTLETGDHSEQRRLAGAGCSDDGDRLGAHGQRGAENEGSPRELDVDVEGFHERVSSLEVSRIAALTAISSTPIEIAWSRLASNRE